MNIFFNFFLLLYLLNNMMHMTVEINRNIKIMSYSCKQNIQVDYIWENEMY